jgi:hypothetical protein
MGTVPIDGI